MPALSIYEAVKVLAECIWESGELLEWRGVLIPSTDARNPTACNTAADALITCYEVRYYTRCWQPQTERKVKMDFYQDLLQVYPYYTATITLVRCE
jgi:hypothetical protein